MPRAPRRETFDENEIGIYHCVNRCVRRAFLCGSDQVSGRSFEHRRQWVRTRLEELASIFAIDHLNFSIMGNHLHLLVRNRPDIRDAWSDEEVARRWRRLFPLCRDEQGRPLEPTADELQVMLADKETLAEWRRRLAHISWFMRCLAEHIAVRANREEEIVSRFWQGRFKAVRILDVSALLACAVYIDLNPIRAMLAATPETSFFTSVYERLTNRLSVGNPEANGETSVASLDTSSLDSESRDGWLSPVLLDEEFERTTDTPVRRASNRGYLPIPFGEYLSLLDWTGREMRADKRGSIPANLAPILERLNIQENGWLGLVTHFGRWFRTAVGRAENLAQEAVRRNREFLHGTSRCRQAFS
jgi:REP element-mobilizing transposase RayT